MTESAPTLRDAEAGKRANAYYALARALQPPREWDQDLPALVAGALGDRGQPLPDLGLTIAGLIRDNLEARESVEVAHARLFLGPFEIKAAPWACFYLEEDPRLMGPVSQFAARAYADAGLAPGENLKDAPDHVTHELEFMYYLAFQQATTAEPEWLQRQERFWLDHLGLWLPRFAEAVNKAEGHPLYQAVADALLALCAQEAAVLGDPSPGGSPDPAGDPIPPAE